MVAEQESSTGFFGLRFPSFGLGWFNQDKPDIPRPSLNETLDAAHQTLRTINDDGRTAAFHYLPLEERAYHAGQVALLTRDVEQMEQRARQAGFDDVITFDHRNIQGMIVVEDRQAFVVFCGTNEFADVLRHGRIVQQPRSVYARETEGESEGARLHAGYHKAVFGKRVPWGENLADIIDRELTGLQANGQVDQVHLTGFSDGGNMAAVIGTELQRRADRGQFPMDVSGVYSFDAPPAGNAAYAAFVEQRLGDRYVRVEPDNNWVNRLWRTFSPRTLDAPEGSVIEVETGKHALYRMVSELRADANASYQERMQLAQAQVDELSRGWESLTGEALCPQEAERWSPPILCSSTSQQRENASAYIG